MYVYVYIYIYMYIHILYIFMYMHTQYTHTYACIRMMSPDDVTILFVCCVRAEIPADIANSPKTPHTRENHFYLFCKHQAR